MNYSPLALAVIVGFALGFAGAWLLIYGKKVQETEPALFQNLLDSAPISLLVYEQSGLIRFANCQASRLLFDGALLQGQNLLALLKETSPVIREALLSEGNTLFSLEHDGEEHSFQILKTPVEIEERAHVLLLINPLTREISRREVAVLKKVIRVISHELNNSLGSMSSLVNSARHLLKVGPDPARLEKVLSAIDERTSHLNRFLSTYASLARLPQPRAKEVEWAPLLARLAQLYPEVKIESPEHPSAWFDESQVEQALINLLKNACEAGGQKSDVELLIREQEGELHLGVLDRGSGFSEEALSQGLLPFFTTKEKGSGMGLALCREIAEGHGGGLRVKRRNDGGSAVYCVLPLKSETRRSSEVGLLSLTSS